MGPPDRRLQPRPRGRGQGIPEPEATGALAPVAPDVDVGAAAVPPVRSHERDAVRRRDLPVAGNPVVAVPVKVVEPVDPDRRGRRLRRLQLGRGRRRGRHRGDRDIGRRLVFRVVDGPVLVVDRVAEVPPAMAPATAPMAAPPRALWPPLLLPMMAPARAPRAPPATAPFWVLGPVPTHPAQQSAAAVMASIDLVFMCIALTH